MADNLDTPSFSIQDTLDMGAGNAELLNDLFAPETASANPNDVKPIINETDPPSPPEPPAKPKGKEIIPPGEEPDGKSIISSFLGSDDDEEEEEDAKPAAKPADNAPSTNDDDDDDAPQGTQFSALANDLFNLGVFSKDEGEEDVKIETAEEFLERFQAEKKKGAAEIVENFIGQFGEDYQNAFEAIFVKGADPKEYFGTYNQIVNFAEMDLSSEDNQVRVMKQTLSDQGFDDEDIETEIERLKNYGDLETVATKHHKVLVKKEAIKLQEIEQKAEQELRQKSAMKQQYVTNVQSIIQDKLKTKEFDGIPLNPKLANELQEFLLVDKWKTPSGETLTDFDRAILDMKRPENHEMKVKVALLLKILEKDPTLSTIQKTGVSKKSNELFGEVARQVNKTKSSSTGNKTNPSSWFL
jgi:hypothetical protein